GGLYVESVLFNYGFRSAPDSKLREELQGLSVEELQVRLQAQNIPLPKNERNLRHLQRALETGRAQAKHNHTLRPNTLIIGISLDRDRLKERFAARVESMLEDGLEQEVRALTDRYGWSVEPLKTIGYREFWPYFNGQASLEE